MEEEGKQARKVSSRLAGWLTLAEGKSGTQDDTVALRDLELQSVASGCCKGHLARSESFAGIVQTRWKRIKRRWAVQICGDGG